MQQVVIARGHLAQFGFEIAQVNIGQVVEAGFPGYLFEAGRRK